MKLETNISLKPMTTFQIGGFASYFCRIRYVQDLIEAAEFLHKSKLPFFVLGEGSNTLVADTGFYGLVMKMEICGVKIRELEGGTQTEIVAGAGEYWDNIVELAVSKGLYGIENLSAIPGSVGAAPVQNIGAYGAEVKDVISFVEVFDLDRAWKKIKGSGKKDEKSHKKGQEIKNDLEPENKQNFLRIMTPEECGFAYRDSIFKKPEGRNLIITKVGFKLDKAGVSGLSSGGAGSGMGGRVNIGYKDLRERFKDVYSKDVTPAQVRQAVVDIRARKLPDWHRVGTAGSFFKNPMISKEHYERLHAEWPDMPGFVEKVHLENSSPAHPITEEKVKVPLAWVLDKVCGLKGWSDPGGRIGTYESQPIVLVNLGGGTADEVRKAAEHISSEVKRLTDIDIEWEVRMVG